MMDRARYGRCGLWLSIPLIMLGACSQEKTTESGAGTSEARVSLPAPQPRDGLIPVGDLAPDFEGVDHTGVARRLSDLLKTKKVVLIFYPGDFTPGCTKQLCDVRDDWSKFEDHNAIVLGINPAGTQRHAEFAMKYHFPFPVISDPMARIAAAYGAKNTDQPEHPIRTVYVIARDGHVALAERGMVPHDRIFAALDRP